MFPQHTWDLTSSPSVTVHFFVLCPIDHVSWGTIDFSIYVSPHYSSVPLPTPPPAWTSLSSFLGWSNTLPANTSLPPSSVVVTQLLGRSFPHRSPTSAPSAYKVSLGSPCLRDQWTALSTPREALTLLIQTHFLVGSPVSIYSYSLPQADLHTVQCSGATHACGKEARGGS